MEKGIGFKTNFKSFLFMAISTDKIVVIFETAIAIGKCEMIIFEKIVLPYTSKVG